MRNSRKTESGRPYPSCYLDVQITALLVFGERTLNYQANFDI